MNSLWHPSTSLTCTRAWSTYAAFVEAEKVKNTGFQCYVYNVYVVIHISVVLYCLLKNESDIPSMGVTNIHLAMIFVN